MALLTLPRPVAREDNFCSRCRHSLSRRLNSFITWWANFKNQKKKLKEKKENHLEETGIGSGGPLEALLDLRGQTGHLLVNLRQLGRLRQQNRQRLSQVEDEKAARRAQSAVVRVVKPRMGRQLLLQQLHQTLVHFSSLAGQLGQLPLPPLGGDRRQLARSVRSHQIVERVAIWPSSVQVEAETGEAETSGPGQELDVPGGSHPLEFVDKRVVLQFARNFARLESVGPVGATLEERHHQDETLGHQRVL